MTAFLNLVLDYIEDQLVEELITNIPDVDVAKAGDVRQGHLQDDPDVLRISIQVFENDPDEFFEGDLTSMKDPWRDEIDEVECGGSVWWNRRFTIKARCLLANTQENLATSRQIAHTVKARIERTLLSLTFTGIKTSDEQVVRGVAALSMKSEVIQGGGPPDAYDFLLKVRFDIQSTQTI
jgi:hypothetical protein